MESLFEFSDYRSFLRKHFEGLPKRGRGKSLELSRHLRVHPTVVSQVLSGQRGFTEEQALETAEFLSLTPLEATYFRLLARIDRAGTAKLRAALKGELAEAREQAKALSKRVAAEHALSDEQRAVFYSSWIYSACRLYCSTSKGGRALEEIMARFSLPRGRALEVMRFLVRVSLAVQQRDRYLMGPQSTFVEQGSPFLPKHHANWRLQAIRSAETLSKNELMFTGPCSLSPADFERLRERLAALVQEFSGVVKKSPPEEVACLNVDFFWVRT